MDTKLGPLSALARLERVRLSLAETTAPVVNPLNVPFTQCVCCIERYVCLWFVGFAFQVLFVILARSLDVPPLANASERLPLPVHRLFAPLLSPALSWGFFLYTKVYRS